MDSLASVSSLSHHQVESLRPFHTFVDFTITRDDASSRQSRSRSRSLHYSYSIQTRAWVTPSCDSVPTTSFNENILQSLTAVCRFATSRALASLEDQGLYMSARSGFCKDEYQNRLELAETELSRVRIPLNISYRPYTPHDFSALRPQSTGTALPEINAAQNQVFQPGPVMGCPCDECTYFTTVTTFKPHLECSWIVNPVSKTPPVRFSSHWTYPAGRTIPTHGQRAILENRRNAFDARMNHAATKYYSNPVGSRATGSSYLDDVEVIGAARKAREYMAPASIVGVLSSADLSGAAS